MVEPCWAPMRLPAMLWTPRIGLPFFTRNWAPVTKKTALKSRLSRRARVMVIVPAIRSTAPLVRSGIRVAGVDSLSSNFTGLPIFFSTFAWTSFARSTEKPPQSLFLSTNPKGGDPVRVPTVNVPVRPIFSSVVSASAAPAPARRTPRAIPAATIRPTSVAIAVAPFPRRRQWARIFDRNCRVRSCRGRSKNASGARLLHDPPLVHEDDPVRHLPGEAHLVGHHGHGHPLAGEGHHHVQDLGDHLGVQGGGRLVEEHDLRLHGEGPRDRHPLLLAARELSRIRRGLVRDVDLDQEIHRDPLRLRAGAPACPDRRQRDVLQHGHVRVEVELLEDHADVSPEPRQIEAGRLHVAPVHGQPSRLDRLESVHAADQCALPRAAGPTHHEDLAACDFQIDVLEDVELAEPLVHPLEADDRADCRAHRPALRSGPSVSLRPVLARRPRVRPRAAARGVPR